MSFLVDPPLPLEVRTDEHGTPVHIQGEPLVGPVLIVQRWVAEVDWWSHPVDREYWRVLLHERLLCEIYRDRLQDRWFVERVFD